MEKLYDKITFNNGASPALNATNLNILSKALDDVDTRLANLITNFTDLLELRTILDTTDYIEKTNVTLGSTQATTIIFESDRINANSAIDPWCSLEGITFDDITTVRGRCTIQVPRQTSATTVNIRIYFK